MGADSRELLKLVQQLTRAGKNLDDVREKIARQEAQSVVTRAKRICTREKIVDTGNLRNSFHAQSPTVSGSSVSVTVGNNADYASFVEYGHLVVGRSGGSLGERRERAMNAGRYVKGKYVLTRAVNDTLRTSDARIARRLRRIYEEDGEE